MRISDWSSRRVLFRSHPLRSTTVWPSRSTDKTAWCTSILFSFTGHRQVRHRPGIDAAAQRINLGQTTVAQLLDNRPAARAQRAIDDHRPRLVARDLADVVIELAGRRVKSTKTMATLELGLRAAG